MLPRSQAVEVYPENFVSLPQDAGKVRAGASQNLLLPSFRSVCENAAQRRYGLLSKPTHMKMFFRLFFKFVRIVLGPFMLVWEKLTTPKAVHRSAAAQARLDVLTDGMVLYQYRTCPFCIRVRRTVAHLALNIERRDVQRDPTSRHELEQQGGQIKVPCLRTRDASGCEEWLYESAIIVRYLQDLARPEVS